MVARNFTGSRGEHICSVLLTEICPGKELPFFKPIFLGERFETLDFMVELVRCRKVHTVFLRASQNDARRAHHARQFKSQSAAKRYASVTGVSRAHFKIVGIDEVLGTGYIVQQILIHQN